MKGGLEGLFEKMKEGDLWVTWGNSVLGGETRQGESPKVRSGLAWQRSGLWAAVELVQQGVPRAEFRQGRTQVT